MTLAEQVKAARKDRNWTQSDLAMRCGVTLRTIQRIEKGEVTPSAYTLGKLVELLALEQEKDLHEISCLARRIRRGDYNDGALRKQQLKPDFREPTPPGSRRRMKKRQPLKSHEKISIVHKVFICHEKHADVAKDFRVSP